MKGHFKGDSSRGRVGMKRVNKNELNVCFPFTFRNSRQDPPLKWSEKAVAQQQTKGTLSEPGS